MALSKAEKIRQLLARNVEQVIERKHLEAALRSGKKLRVKLGIDPTGEKIHIGRAVQLWKLREFQELGHKIVLIVGDFTARVGDPSDKLEKRPMLTRAEIAKNMKHYLPQIGKILDLKKVEVRYNSEWLDKLDFMETAELAESFSVNQMLRRRAFRERFKKDADISLREFLYPLMQGYDSVAVKADVELGGTDQLFNLMAGRQIQPMYGQKPQDIMTMKMLLGLDGRKMSTSWGNVINIADAPDEQFGKLMAMHDKVIMDYFRMATRLLEKDIVAHEKALKGGANPRDVKLALAKEIVTLYHGKAAAEKAAERWKEIFSEKRLNIKYLTELKLPDQYRQASCLNLVFYICKKSSICESKSQARRLINQGSVEVKGKVVRDLYEPCMLSGGEVIKVGKKNFFKVRL